MRLAKALTLGLLLALAGLVSAETFGELNRRVGGMSDQAASQAIRSSLSEDADLGQLIKDLPKSITQLRSIIANRAVAESAHPNASATVRVKKAKAANPLYRYDDKEKQGGNWLAKAYEKLGEALRKLLEGREPNLPNIAAPPPLFGQWLVYLMWGLLGVVLIAFLVLAIRHFSWKAKLKRKASALLDEDEPERTLDEWLNLADEHERAGRFREAVRCLYLACLLKFDEYGVARFDRGQTNWEHLGRITKSPTMPPGLDFDPPTRAFDRVWYGMIVEGRPDVDRFREWYHSVLEGVRGHKA